jgi:NAD(P)-dependent dehydrogenase (short-subunit alcohol dehydrogenase family)
LPSTANASTDRGAVLITGASSGIGEACALHLAGIGFAVFGGVRKTDDAERLAERSGGAVTPVTLDVTDAEQIEETVRTLESWLAGRGGDRLAGVVNNAGIAVPGPLEFLPLDELRRQLEVNTVGPVAVTQAFMPMLRKGRGRVVLVGSAGGVMVAPFLGAYSASKFALEAVADALRMELRPWSIRVSLVDPGSISTSIWERGTELADDLLERMPPEATELYGPAIPKVREAARQAERRGRPPEEVAKVVAHALTATRPKARYFVGPDAKGQAAAARLLPSRWKDKLVSRVMGLPR